MDPHSDPDTQFGSGSRRTKITLKHRQKYLCSPVWPIRDVYPGSRIRTVSIPDPGSWILNKEFKYFNPSQKKAKKWFPSSKKYDPSCSSRIPDPDADFLPSRIPDPGVKKAPNPGCQIPDPDPQHCCSHDCWNIAIVAVAKAS
jgi:hypothetical protein